MYAHVGYIVQDLAWFSGGLVLRWPGILGE